MDLSEAINKAIDLFGSDILLDSKKLANILSDYQAFSSPSHKHILFSMLEEGYGAKFISVDSLNNSSKRLFILDTIKAIENNMGFQHDATVFVVNSISKALNWNVKDDIIEQVEEKPKPVQPSRQKKSEKYTQNTNLSSPKPNNSAGQNNSSNNNKTFFYKIIVVIAFIIAIVVFIVFKSCGGHTKIEQTLGNSQPELIKTKLNELYINRDTTNANSIFIADLALGMSPEEVITQLQKYGISYGIEPEEGPTIADISHVIPNTGRVLFEAGFDDNNSLRFLSFNLNGSFETVRKHCEKVLGVNYIEILNLFRDQYCYWFRGNQCILLNNTTINGSYLEISDIGFTPDSLYSYSCDPYDNLRKSYDIYKTNKILYKCQNSYFDVPRQYDSIASNLYNAFYIAYQSSSLSSINKYTGVLNDSVFVRYGWDFDYSDWKWYRSYTKKFTTKNGETMLLDKPNGKTLIGHGSKDYEISVGSYNNNLTFTVSEEQNGWSLVPLSLVLGHVQGWIKTSEIVEVPIEKRRLSHICRSRYWDN